MKWFLFALLMLACLTGRPQTISDILEKSLSAVVTVAVDKTSETVELLGYKGNESNVAYDNALDLSGFSGSGSGFVIERSGMKYVVTNAHVVELGAGEEGSISVFSISRKEYKVKIFGGDSFYDLAVLEFITPPGPEITTLSLRTSTARIGENVYAIGNPCGEFPYSVSNGIISALNRSRDVSITGRFGFLQSTATVIWGNSGGPLIDGTGQVVGINSQIYAKEKGGEMYIQPQINFALDSRIAFKIINDLFLNAGMVRRAFIGLEISQTYNTYSTGSGIWFPETEYPVITGIIPGSPASTLLAGMEGAEIKKLNDLEVENTLDVLQGFENTAPGAKISITISKDGIEKVITLTAESQDHDKLTAIARFFFENQQKGKLSISNDGNVLYRAEHTNQGYSSSTYSTKSKPDKSNQPLVIEKVVLAAGLDYPESSVMYRISSISDLGAVLRLCGSEGFISLYLTNAYGDSGEIRDLYFSPDKKLKKVIWY